MMARTNSHLTETARELRTLQTTPESLLWTVLRRRQLCSLKFRRQHPIGPFVADFACIKRSLIVELDGGYHDYVYEYDQWREGWFRALGWDVLRFANEDVRCDVDAVVIAIARHLDLVPIHRGRRLT